MEKLKIHKLNYEKTIEYFAATLKGVNQLSDLAFSYIKSSSGCFFTFLPENTLNKALHEFDFGGKTSCLRDEIALFVEQFIRSNPTISCVFDDYNATFNDAGNDLYCSNGMHYKNEVYYVIKNEINKELIDKCMQYSSALWHSLFILTDANHKDSLRKELTCERMKAICVKAKLIAVEAYDGEGYVFWEPSANGRVIAQDSWWENRPNGQEPPQ